MQIFFVNLINLLFPDCYAQFSVHARSNLIQGRLASFPALPYFSGSMNNIMSRHQIEKRK